jgi:hypothetical protein
MNETQFEILVCAAAIILLAGMMVWVMLLNT